MNSRPDPERTPPEELAARRVAESLIFTVLTNWPAGKVGAIRAMHLDPVGLANLRADHLQHRMPEMPRSSSTQ